MGREFVNYKGGLKPSFRFLSDKAVIIQAWKKAHEYMRRHNWYSDNFELDCSCINLEELLLDIQSCFKNPNDVRYMPIPARVVPAPKATPQKAATTPAKGFLFLDSKILAASGIKII